jgi:hypothetical protein
MRSLLVTNTASADLSKAKVPFTPNYTVVALNVTAGVMVLQSCDTVAGTYTTLATVPVGSTVDVVINKPFLKCTTAGPLILLGN